MPQTEAWMPELGEVRMPSVGILVGSLRKDSLNFRLAEEAKTILAETASIEIIIPDVPLFSQDFERPDSEPCSPAGRELREKFRESDALLVCSPEYDRLPSAITLNACHWASRQPNRPLAHKPVMLSGVSPGQKGTRRARPALRLAFEAIGCNVLETEVFVSEGEKVWTDIDRLLLLREELRKKLPKLILG